MIRVARDMGGKKASCPGCSAKLFVSSDLAQLSLLPGAQNREYSVGPSPKGQVGTPSNMKADVGPNAFLDEVISMPASSPLNAPQLAPAFPRRSNKMLTIAGGGLVVVAVLIGLVTFPSWAAKAKPDVETIANQLLRKNDVFELQVKVKNPNDFSGKLHYKPKGKVPSGFEVDADSGRCSWLATNVSEGDYPIALEVAPESNAGAATLVEFTIRVYREHNIPRVLVGGYAPTVPKEGDVVRVFLNGDDIDGDPITYEYRLQHSLQTQDWVVARSENLEFDAKHSGDWVLQVRARDESGTSPPVTHIIRVVSKNSSPSTSPVPQFVDGTQMPAGANKLPSEVVPAMLPSQIVYHDLNWDGWIFQFKQFAYNTYNSRIELDAEREAISAIIEMCRLHPECMNALIDIVAGYRLGLAENGALRLRDIDKIFDFDALPKSTTYSLAAAGHEDAVRAIYENKMQVETRYSVRTQFHDIDRKDWVFLSLVDLVGPPAIPALVKAVRHESMVIPACSSLGKLGMEAVPALTDLLDSSSAPIAFHAIWALALALRVTDGNAYVRYDDSLALHKNARERLQKLIYHDDANVHAAAAILLSAWAQNDVAHLPRIAAILTQQLVDATDAKQERAAMLLGGLPNIDEEYVGAVKQAIEKRNVPTAFVISQLQRFGEVGRSLHLRLIQTGAAGKSHSGDVELVRLNALAGAVYLDDSLGPTREMVISIGDAAVERNEKIRNRALQTLRDLGVEGKPASDVLRRLMKEATTSELHRRLVIASLDNLASGKKPKIGVARSTR